MTLRKLLVFSLVVTVLATGCNEKESKKAVETKPQQPARSPSNVVVPDSVKGKWKAVKLAVADKNTQERKVYTIAIGEDFKLPGSDLTLRVENFLPHFTMEGTTLTSQSNELRNPAAQLQVTEKGREIYKGWLFTLYPTAHAFQHPQYGFTLVDYVASSS